ncbi:MAG: hypothetical protein Kow00105_01270 [Phycisphaeraceae bacterium]
MLTLRSVVSHVRTLCVAMTITAVPGIQTATADVPAALAQAPADAQFILIVPDMARLSGDIARFNQDVGLDLPELADALSAFKTEVGIENGLNDSGAALVVVNDLASAISSETEPDMLLILPVTDYQAFVSNFEQAAEAPQVAGVTALTMPDGQPGFAREVGGYAVMGEKAELVANYTPGGDAGVIAGRVGTLGQDYLGDCDAAIYIDLEAIAPVLSPKIDELLSEFNNEMAQAAEMGMDAGSLATMQAAMALYAKSGKAILNSSQGLVVTLDLSDQGVGFTAAVNFKADSQVMQYLPGGGGGLSSMLSRLPKGSYLLAGAFDAKAIACSELMEAALSALPEGNPQIDLYRKALPLIKQMQQYAGVLYTPEPGALMGGAGGLSILQTYRVEDPEAYMQATKEYLTSLNGFELPMAMPMPMQEGGAMPSMTYATSYTENALQLDGVQVDQYSMQMQMPPELMMQMGPAAGFMQMFTNFNGYAAQADGFYVSTTTLDQQLMSNALKTGKTGDGLGAGDPIAQVREHAIPDGAVAEVYLSIGGVTETVGPMAMMFGVPPIQAPQDLPPVAVGLGLQDTSAASRLYVPNDVVKFVVDTVNDIKAQMQGPGGPGAQPHGPGAPPPPF